MRQSWQRFYPRYVLLLFLDACGAECLGALNYVAALVGTCHLWLILALVDGLGFVDIQRLSGGV